MAFSIEYSCYTVVLLHLSFNFVSCYMCLLTVNSQCVKNLAGNVLVVSEFVAISVCYKLFRYGEVKPIVYSAVLYANRYFYSITDYYCSRDIPNAMVTSFSCNLVVFKLRTSYPLFVHVFPTNAECKRSCVSEALIALNYVDISILL